MNNKNKINSKSFVREKENKHYVRCARTKPSPGSNLLALQNHSLELETSFTSCILSTIVYADER